jgi:hypothetical protein
MSWFVLRRGMCCLRVHLPFVGVVLIPLYGDAE